MSARIMIAGTGSGSGKTSAVCGLLGALLKKDFKVTSFKTGPDYVDPLFHQQVLGIDSYNLDVFLSGETTVKRLVKEKSRNSDISIIEGVMGFYDGMSSKSLKASSQDVARITGTPTILVINCKGKAVSIAAEINGFLNFAENNIVGVILNFINPAMYDYYKEIVQDNCDTKVFGYLPYTPEAAITEERLGLDSSKIGEYKEQLGKLADIASESLDIDKILEHAQQAKELEVSAVSPRKISEVNIAVAKDEAFSFYYSSDYEILERLGASLQFFSPLSDEKLPHNIDGIIIGGGYLEQNIKKLYSNTKLLNSIYNAASAGTPILAQGAGAVMLSRGLQLEGDFYRLAGVFDTEFSIGTRLQNFGYHNLTALQDNILSKTGETFRMHEYHYYKPDKVGDVFTAKKPAREQIRSCGYKYKNTLSMLSYTNFSGNEQIAENFIIACKKHKEERIDEQ